MINIRKKKLIVFSLVAIYIVTGFFREFIFLNINEQIRLTYYHDTDSHVAPSLHWISTASYATLYYSKWILTFLFTAFFAFLAARTIKIAFQDHSLVKITWSAYAIIFVTGLLFYLGGAISGNSQNTYAISRFLAGLTETPALLVILSASFLAIRRN